MISIKSILRLMLCMIISLCSIVLFSTADVSFAKILSESSAITVPADKLSADYHKVVYAKDYGAYGDGRNDDTQAISQALNSGADAVVLEENAAYKITDYIVMQTSGITILGNGATLFTDNDYRSRDNYHEFFFNIMADDITIENLKIEARETVLVGYKTQVGIQQASNIMIDSCTFIIPSTVLSDGATHDIEYTNLDLFTGWYNVTVKNSTLINLADTNAGVCAEFRDLNGYGASDLTFTNNTCTSNCHDEIIAMFSGTDTTITNVNITNNNINALEGTISNQRTIGISLGYNHYGLNGIKFTGNIVNISSEFSGFFMGDSKNVLISDNTINYTALSPAVPAYIFRGTNNDNSIYITNNEINIMKNESSDFGGISNGILNLTSNHIICDANVSDALFGNNSIATNNTLIVNGAAARLGSAIITLEGNHVTFNNTISTMFEFYNKQLTTDVNINDNIIVCKKSTKTNDTFIMLNGTRINDFKFSFTNNNVVCPKSSSKKTLAFMAIADTTTQDIIMVNNSTSQYTITSFWGGRTSKYNIVTA